MEALLTGLRAAGEPTRLRLLMLLARSELTVSELTQILRQSQPRVSRHLKLLCEAGLLDRFREGSWVFYRLANQTGEGDLVQFLVQALPADDPVVARDLERLKSVKEARVQRAAAFFRENADEWDLIRALYVPEVKVEDALSALVPDSRLNAILDLGTGTGRMLEIFADKADRAEGVDLSPEMLSFARTRLDDAGLTHVHVRQGDIFDLTFVDGEFDLVTLHQVLHYLDDPAASIQEAARVLSPGGRLLIADFAPHDLDFLRDEQAHRRLGFAKAEISDWCRSAGLEVVKEVALPPDGDEAKLTVLIWAAEKPAETGGGKKGEAV
ncbi:MAG: ArsR family transcriptional regulator [Parvibaculum sp.]|nr:ArsR family transcriptional regulator [Parvibaculum sp.]